MPWIETHNPSPEHPELVAAMQAALAGYPPEYAPGSTAKKRLPEEVSRDSIVTIHSLAPTVLQHIFTAYREMISPNLPLERRQQEMIAATVSILNDCHY
jgi:hypothetical protein